MAVINVSATGAAQTFTANSGDTFVISGNINHNVTINGATNFTVEFNETLSFVPNTTRDLIRFGQDSEVTVKVASGVDVSNFEVESLRGTSVDVQIGDGATIGRLDLGDVTDSAIITAGNNVTLEEGVIGSSQGAVTNYTFGDGLNVTGNIEGNQSTSSLGENSITIGSGANISGDITMTAGSPNSITLGNDVTVGGDVEWGTLALNGSLTAGTGLTVGGTIIGSGSSDTVIIGDDWAIDGIALGLGNDQLSLGSWSVNTDPIIRSISGDTGSDGLRLKPPVGQETAFEAAATAASWAENPDGSWSPTTSSFTFPFGGYDFSYFGAAPTTPLICFTAGTQIEVANGDSVNIEDLRQGDMVMTVDHGLQAVKWIGIRKISVKKLIAQPHLKPIRIQAGALGSGLPKQDLIVSPQHRIVVRSDIAQKMFGTNEVLIAAKHLVMLDGIDILTDDKAVTYVHFLCDQHEVVFANGAPSESLYTGPEALKSVSPKAVQEILEIFPELSDINYKALSARTLANGRKSRQLAVRHKNNNKPLLAEMH